MHGLDWILGGTEVRVVLSGLFENRSGLGSRVREWLDPFCVGGWGAGYMILMLLLLLLVGSYGGLVRGEVFGTRRRKRGGAPILLTWRMYLIRAFVFCPEVYIKGEKKAGSES